jgi:hypothetical protein
MLFSSKMMPLVFLVIIILAGCSVTSVTNSSTNTTSPAPTPTPVPPTLSTGTWTGLAMSSSGDTFDMTLIIATINGDTFTGKLVTGVVNTPTYREDTIMNGKIAANRITFSTPTQVMSILDNYQATVSNGQMTGSWATQDQPPLTGKFTLHKTA